ncbi:MAG: SusC/RagA family TonB-linked outer membrane protein [Bacteroidota bacterium]
MKLSTFILLISLLQVSAKGFSQITLNEKHVLLEQVIQKIEKQTNYVFIYDEDKLAVKFIDVKVNNVSIERALDACFKNGLVTYSIVGNNVILKPVEPTIFDKVKDLFTYSVRVQGIVTDTTGRPLSKATVFFIKKKLAKPAVVGQPVLSDVKQPTKPLAVTSPTPEIGDVVHMTDENGRFDLEAEEGDEIGISFIGYQTFVFTVKSGMPSLNIKLRTVSEQLEEIVIETGFQKLSKERVTGAFGKPNMQKFSQRTGSNDIISRLDGLVAGLTVRSGQDNYTANPNGNGATQQQSIIRGRTSVTISSDPLYVLNGVPVSDFSNVNPDDVADITVLKDAAASAIWGARAANGVIVVVTKRGGSQRLKINYNGYFNYKGKPDFDYVYDHQLSSSEYIQAARETFDPVNYPYFTLSRGFVAPHESILYNQSAGLITAAQANASLDSLARIENRSQIESLWFNNASTMNHTVSASGGNGTYNFYGSLSYIDNKSNAHGAKNNAYRINLNQDISPASFVKIQLSTSLSKLTSGASRPISIGAAFLPYQLFQDANGNNIKLNYVQGLTPETRADFQARSRINLDYSPLDEINSGFTKYGNLALNTTGDVTVKIWKGLSAKGTYSYQLTPGTTSVYDDISKYSQRKELVANTVSPTSTSTPVYNLPTTGGRYQTGNNDQRNWTVRHQLVYDTDLRNNKDHLSVQMGQEAQEQLGTSSYTILRGYDRVLNTYTSLNYVSLGNFSNGVSGFGSFNEKPFAYSENRTRFTSYFGLINYQFNQKYLFDGSIRTDHSNLFGNDVSGQKKPSYSLGGKWVTSKEDFMKNVDWIDNLAIRATYGVSGNSPFTGSGAAFDILSVITPGGGFGPTITTGNALGVSSFANKKLTWESTKTYNLGVDFSVLKNRLIGGLDFYKKNTKDLLGLVQLNPLGGTTSSLGNIGNLSNRGIELSLQSVNLKIDDFSWSTNFVFSYNNNKLLSYTNQTSSMLTDLYRLGGSNGFVPGFSTYAVFAYQYAGLDNLGDPQIKLANGTVHKALNAASADDLKYMGSTIPVYNGGFGNTFSYKGISLSANMIYSFGAVMRRDMNTFFTDRLTGSAGSFTGNINAEFADRWKVPGDESRTNIPSYVSSMGTSFSRRNLNYYQYADINVVSASYIKLRDITLSYQVPSKFLQAIKVESFNIFVQSGNYMVWKANKFDIDPEYGNNSTFNIPQRSLPANGHTFSVGLNASF